jgi:hypothetical protein
MLMVVVMLMMMLRCRYRCPLRLDRRARNPTPTPTMTLNLRVLVLRLEPRRSLVSGALCRHSGLCWVAQIIQQLHKPQPPFWHASRRRIIAIIYGMARQSTDRE